MTETGELRIGVVGAGRMGEAIVRGLIDSGTVGADRIVCSDPREERVAELASLGVTMTRDNTQVVDRSDVVLLCVKPQVLAEVVDGISGRFRDGQLVVSIAAGVRSGLIETRVGRLPVVRVMPNTPMLVGQGMSAICGGQFADATHLATVSALLEPLGRVVVVDEDDMDAVTAVSGSGPAYLFTFAEALIAAGVDEGLDAGTATKLAVQTLLGAATMLERDPDPARLRDQVTSPGGTTMAALEELDRHGLSEAVAAAVRAARRRGEQLAGG